MSEFSSATHTPSPIASLHRRYLNTSKPLKKLSSLEARFLSQWEKQLTPAHWEEYLLTWFRASLPYHTPLFSLQSTKYFVRNFVSGGVTYPFFSSQSGLYSYRRSLMQNQLPYIPHYPRHMYPHALHLDNCPLCQNIAQSIDCAVDDASPSNAIIDLHEHIVLPNRYPAHPGASLFLRKSHDDLQNRHNFHQPVTHSADSTSPTYGNLLSAVDLATLFTVADQYSLVAIRNHPLDGMSIPHHDHTHLLPTPLIPQEVYAPLLDTSTQREVQVEEVSLTPFSTLRISGGDLSARASLASNVLAQLEQMQHFPTFTYIQGNLFITPRTSLNGPLTPALGGGISIHYVDCADKQVQSSIARYIPHRGNFSWNKIFQ